MIIKTYNATDIFSVVQLNPLNGNPDWANLKIESTGRLAPLDVRGPGIYGIFFRERLIYIGKFLGTQADICGGNVCSIRWAKHIGTLSLRDRRISFSNKAITMIRDQCAKEPPFDDIIRASEHPIPVVTDDRGRVSSFNRACFAAEHWDFFTTLADARGLVDFRLLYVKLDDAEINGRDNLRQIIGEAETKLIAALRPRCNKETNIGASRDVGLEDARQSIENELRARLGPIDPTRVFDASDEATTAPIDHPPRRPQSSAGATPNTDDQRGAGLPPIAQIEAADEDPGCEAAFFEELAGNPDALNAVHSVIAAFDGVADAYVKFTCTEGGDLRIRSTAGPRTFFNVATLFWQPRLEQFRSEILLPPQRCLEIGAATALPNYPGQTLPTRATFQLADAAAVIRAAFVEAATLYRDQQGH